MDTIIDDNKYNDENVQNDVETNICFENIKYECIMIEGFTNTSNVEINGRYCVYECDDIDYRYPEYVQQETCSYYIKWTSSRNYIIYSYDKQITSNGDTINIYASSQSCDENKIALSNLQSCSYWETYYENHNGLIQTKITIHPYQESDDDEPIMDLCHDQPVIMGLNTGEIAAIVIVLLVIFLILFGSAINYWE